MNKKSKIVIIGAGPSGLSMAVFLSDLGFSPIIIDKKLTISDYSKALGINPRTLDIMKPYGIADRFISNGRKMAALNLWSADKHLYKNKFESSHVEFPFMLIQPQKESEEILLDEALKRGVAVEYGIEFNSWNTTGNTYEVFTKEEKSFQHVDFIIGADGGDSLVRKQLG